MIIQFTVPPVNLVIQIRRTHLYTCLRFADNRFIDSFLSRDFAVQPLVIFSVVIFLNTVTPESYLHEHF